MIYAELWKRDMQRKAQKEEEEIVERKRKNDERMNILEQERDWFRTEAIRLDKVCKGLC